MKAGLVEGEHLSVDGSFIQANASRSSRIPREQLTELDHVKRTVREYLTDLELNPGMPCWITLTAADERKLRDWVRHSGRNSFGFLTRLEGSAL